MLQRYIPNGAVAEVYEDVNAVVYLAGNGRESPYVAYGYSGKRSKPDFKFRYRTAIDRLVSVAKYIKGLRDRVAEKLAYIAKVKAEAPELKVCDVLYTSWGYDQTNVDFYMVVKVSPSGKSVDIVPIGQTYEASGDMCGYTTPVPARFTGDVIKNKRVNAYGGVRIASYATARKYDGQPKYTSSYA